MRDYTEAARDMGQILHHALNRKSTVMIPVEHSDGVVRNVSVYKSQLVDAENDKSPEETHSEFAAAWERSFVDTELRDEFARFKTMSKEEQRAEAKYWQKQSERELGEDLC